MILSRVTLLKPRSFQRLKVKYDVPLSNFAFNFNLRRYHSEWCELVGGRHYYRVGRCRLTPGCPCVDPALTVFGFSAPLEAKI
jgi:hypothetical protein